MDVMRNPNEHMSFGRGGPHMCLGNALARLEIRIMFEDLLPRIDSMEQIGRSRTCAATSCTESRSFR